MLKPKFATPEGTTLRCYAHDHITTLSLRKTKSVYFQSHACMWALTSPATGCACPFFVSDVLVVPQPIGRLRLTSWPIVTFGSVPALLHHFMVRRLPFSVISNHHDWKPAPGGWISSKKCTPKFPGRVLYRNVSVHCTISVEHQACEVQHLFLQFLGLFCRPWQNVWRQKARQLEVSHQQRKSDRKYAEDFPWIFMGCEMPSSQHLDVIWVEMLFTNCSAEHHSLCSRSWHLFWRTFFLQKWGVKEDHVYIYAMLKI